MIVVTLSEIIGAIVMLFIIAVAIIHTIAEIIKYKINKKEK